jgi:hypothetical protein
MMRFDLSDEEWAVLEPLMPSSRKSARKDDRKIMNAIFYVLRTGIPWRDLPERYGPSPIACWSFLVAMLPGPKHPDNPATFVRNQYRTVSLSLSYELPLRTALGNVALFGASSMDKLQT